MDGGQEGEEGRGAVGGEGRPDGRVGGKRINRGDAKISEYMQVCSHPVSRHRLLAAAPTHASHTPDVTRGATHLMPREAVT